MMGSRRSSRKKVYSPFAKRFAELAIRIWKGDRTVINDLKRIMPRPETIEETDQGIVGKGPSNNTVYINYGIDPMNVLVFLAYLYAGTRWLHLDFFDEASRIAIKIWRDEIKALKQKQSDVETNTGFTPEKAWDWLDLTIGDLVEIYDLAEEALEALVKKDYRRVRKYLKEIVDIAYPWTK